MKTKEEIEQNVQKLIDKDIFDQAILAMEEHYGSGCDTEIDAYFRGAKWMQEQINKQEIMKENQIKRFNENSELNISDVSDSFTKKDLFEAFSHYAFKSISNQPYNEEELFGEFEEWFKRKYSK